jgi:hypothetical protein
MRPVTQLRPTGIGPRVRRGITAVMAMLYLVLFSTLALGFYAAVTSSVQVAANEQRSTLALLAAESGMEFMKLQLATLGVPALTPQAELWDQVYARLSVKLDNTANMPAGSRLVGVSDDGLTLLIPDDQTQWISLDSAGRSRFRATVTKKGTGDKLEVTVIGAHGNVTAGARGLKLDYDNAANEAKIFDYGVATPGKIFMNGNVTIRGTAGNDGMGSVMSAFNDPSDPVALVMTGTPEISGKAFFVNPDADPSVAAGAEINGKSPGEPGYDDGIVKGVENPEFPTIDTSAFKLYATTPYNAATMGGPGATLTNVKLPPGNYIFNGCTINGVLYVQQPSTIKFSGSTTVNGAIVVDNAKAGTPAGNTMQFNHVVSGPMPSSMPLGLKDLGGSFLLADNFTVGFGGNFNTVNGSIVASQVNFAGTAGGTIKGTVLNLGGDPLNVAGTSDIIIESQGAQNRPSGLFFGSHYEPVPDSFTEIKP